MENNQQFSSNPVQPSHNSPQQDPRMQPQSAGPGAHTARLGNYAVAGYHAHASQQSPVQPVPQPAYGQPAYYPPQAQQPYQTPQPTPQQPVQVQSALGRIGRVGFLLGLLYSTSLMWIHIALLLLLAATGVMPDNPSDTFELVFNAFNILINLCDWVFMIVCGVMVVIRRLHDLNLSGWAALLYFVPLVGAFLGLYMLFAPGKEPNKYGPPLKSWNFWVLLGLKKPKPQY